MSVVRLNPIQQRVRERWMKAGLSRKAALALAREYLGSKDAVIRYGEDDIRAALMQIKACGRKTAAEIARLVT